MRLIWPVLVVLCLSLTGCRAVGRWMAPIQPAELPEASRRLLADKDKEFEQFAQDADKHLEDIKADAEKDVANARKATAARWLCVILFGFSGLAFVLSMFYTALIDRKPGFKAVLASAGCMGAFYTWLEWGWEISLGVGMMIGVYLTFALVYAIRDMKKKRDQKEREFNGVVESVEAAKAAIPPDALTLMADFQDKIDLREPVRQVRKRLASTGG